MRRWVAVLGCLALVPRLAMAQVPIDTAGAWTFTFAGNAGAFYVFALESDNGSVVTPGAVVGIGRRGSAVRSGYLPSFAVLEASGVEGSTALSVHFGLAPVVQTAGGHDDPEGLGARVDLRQAYLTVGGDWGEVLAGREVGVFFKQSMLDDMTLFGTGAVGGISGNPGGTTLGHGGFGYIFPGFNAQIAYHSPNNREIQYTVAIFDPSINNGFDELLLPRLEAEASWERNGVVIWGSGLAQHQRDTRLDASATAWGASAGARISRGGVTLSAQGYWGQGIGATLLFQDGRTSDTTSVNLRPGFGYLGQVTWRQPGSALTVGASFGASQLENALGESPFKTINRAATAGAYLQATPSLKVVGEITHAWSSDAAPATSANRALAVATGLMLFF
ncbi:MAG TPA: porin [Gemmatimonadales bacterium]|nr:porin [Gemmatimonadales bacterium]